MSFRETKNYWETGIYAGADGRHMKQVKWNIGSVHFSYSRPRRFPSFPEISSIRMWVTRRK